MIVAAFFCVLPAHLALVVKSYADAITIDAVLLLFMFRRQICSDFQLKKLCLLKGEHYYFQLLMDFYA